MSLQVPSENPGSGNSAGANVPKKVGLVLQSLPPKNETGFGKALPHRSRHRAPSRAAVKETIHPQGWLQQFYLEQAPRLQQTDGLEYPRTPSKVSADNPPWPAYRGYHEYSFAHATMSHRLPTILAKAIDDVRTTLNDQYDEEKIVDLVECMERMEDLMDDLQSNATLRPIIDDGEGDIPLWNKEIAKYFRGKDFMNAPWLFAEAYKYRRLHECFSLSKFWKSYDVFFRQKCETFSRSGDAVFELSTRFADPYVIDEKLSAEDQLKAKKLIFHELTQVALWGNATDLSLLINMTEDDIKNLQSTGGDHLAATEKNILGNHLEKVWDLISSPNFGGGKKGGRIDIVLDNGGFELHCDMVYADFLIQSGLASQVRFHGKRFAWFVSDVTRPDFDWLINQTVYGHLFTDATEDQIASLRLMGQRWQKYVKEGIFVYEQHPFWISGWTYWHLKREAPDLFLHLADSDLVIFKGDLNHRKLTYDCHAPHDTPFDIAIGPLGSDAGAPPVLTLRTIKSDVVVGIPSEEGVRLDKEEPGWKISAKVTFCYSFRLSYAVVLLSEGHKGEPIAFD
ncbi:BQ2448_6893 [Microbotryum intermedium]|uniref:Sugar phosphate phosphatase n=1 Tax=Microbotryum intermedium TaxID=269621 RepID=A0A238FP35_9BASI|nr:BQ2448_6893 [Microbotryum intermedium]